MKWLIVALVLLAAPAHARLGNDVLAALTPVESGPPWLERVAECRDAPRRAETAFLPFECMPPAAVTLGFETTTAEVASFESERHPGCGELLPRWLERRAPGAARARVRVDLQDVSLSARLARMWTAIAELAVAFVAPVRPIGAEARVVNGDASVRVAVVLGPPLEGWLVHLDPVDREVELLGPTGESHRLASLPPLKEAQASIWDVAVSPDARWIVLRLAAIEGNPCDPAELQRLDLQVPERARVPLGPNIRWSLDERACLFDRDIAACNNRCNVDPRRCADVARIIFVRERERARQLFQRACEAGDGAACLDEIKLRPEDDQPMIKGEPSWVAPMRAHVKRSLTRDCEAGDVDACVRILELRGRFDLWSPRQADLRNAKDNALRHLRAACARNEAACERLEAVRQMPPR